MPRGPALVRAPDLSESGADLLDVDRPESTVEPAELADLVRRENRIADLRIALMSRTLREETVDHGWARTTERAFLDAAGSRELTGSRLTGVECRSTLCKVDVEHENAQAAELWSAVFPLRIASVSSRVMERRYVERAGHRRSTAFVARMGHRLPTLEEPVAQ